MPTNKGFANKERHLGKERAALRDYYTQTTFKNMKTLTLIAKKSSINPTAKFNNLIKLISDKGILYQAMGTVQKNKGALTKGPIIDQTTADAASDKLIEDISKQLKDGTFKFKPIRRIYMEKSGKEPVNKEKMIELENLHKKGKVTMDQIKELRARPLGISSFPDKIVQEAIRMVLHSIYEPEFAKQNVNFGFRTKYGCQDAIDHITKYAKQMDYVIEADIKGAFDNVNHTTLIDILKRKISDERFLKLIFNGLKCGVMFLNYIQDSDVGTTQGSVCSPILYNIYFNEFDKFINTEFKEKIHQINIEENRKDRPINKLYASISKKKTLLHLGPLIKQIKELKQTNKNKELLYRLQSKVKETIIKYKELDKAQKKLPVFALSRQTIRFTYVRYADDWVFFTNASKERVLEWKELFAKFIKDKLQLTLSPEKTKLTDLRKNGVVRFLGYQLVRMRKRKNINLRTVGQTIRIKKDVVRRSVIETVKAKETTTLHYVTRAANPTLIVAWDRDRVLSRLESNGFIRKTVNSWRGKAKAPWVTLSEPEIVERYNYIIRGYINYYSPVTHYPTDIQFLHYLLDYSCKHTLAQKRNTTLRTIIKKFGKKTKINYTEKITKQDKLGNQSERIVNKTIEFLHWDKCTEIIKDTILSTLEKKKKKQSISLINKSIDDISNIKINWRTKHKLSNHCAICGSEVEVQYHHVKHIRKGKIEGFLQVMNQLNRKQIPCCRLCHYNIHRGKYDGIKLKDLYDEELIII